MSSSRAEGSSMHRWLLKLGKKKDIEEPPLRRLPKDAEPSQNHGGNGYRYRPLEYDDSIRLLSLQPGENPSPIHINLRDVQLEDGFEYEALSYCWATEDGDDERSRCISCKGASIWVTKNCEAALRRFRRRSRPRVMWIDAICIDQENEKERGHQVGLMRLVYAHATQVLIWLGEASKEIDKDNSQPLSDFFLEKLTSVAEDIWSMEEKSKPPQESLLYKELLREVFRGALDGSPTTSYTAFIAIIQRRWWQRIWVVQEAHAAKKAMIYCGGQSATYDAFELLYDVLERDPSRESNYMLGISDMISSHFNTSFYAKQNITFDELHHQVFKLLFQSRMLKATDPRDKIFGMLGLFKQMKTILPAPDYTRSPVEVFTDAFKLWQEGEGWLDMLYMAAREEKDPDYPSWVADWSQPHLMYYYTGSWSYYKAAQGSKFVCEISNDDKELRAKGRQVDKVTQISLAAPIAYKFGIASSTREAIAGWQTSYQLWSDCKCSLREAVPWDALWRTMCWNVRAGGTEYPASIETEGRFKEFYQIVMSEKERDKIYEELLVLQESFHNLAQALPLCITANGHLASVPPTTRTGDHIVILTGGHMPFILRPIEDSKHYTLVGHCYVHGIMDGEAFPENEDELDWISIL